VAEQSDTPRIVCVTLSSAVDRTLEVRGLELGQHAKGRLVSRHPAGKAVNVARVLQHLGQGCVLTGFVGETERAMFEKSFDTALVRTQLFGLDVPTRENITLVDPEAGLETHVRDEGPEISADDQDRLVRKLRILAMPNIWLVFAGSLPRGLDVGRFREMLRAVMDRGARVVLDSSEGALGVVQDMPVWLIKPNRAELAALSGRKTDTSDDILRAADSVKQFARMVLVSAGADGCYLIEGDAVLHGHMKDLPKRIANTVGSGDALLAGFLAARAGGADPEGCVRHAVATATSACLQLQAGEVDPAEVPALAGQVAIDRLAG